MGTKHNWGTSLIQQHLEFCNRSSYVFIDIGAYTGNYTSALCERFPKAHIHAIEACPVIFEVLNRRDSPNLTTHHLAIGDCNKDVNFYVIPNPAKPSQSNSLFRDFVSSKGKKFKKVSVPQATLDEFCRRQRISEIDYLKINCEGCEYKIFDAPTLDFLERTHVMLLSLHGKCERFLSQEFKAQRRKISETMKAHDFELVKSEGEASKKLHAVQFWRKKT